MDKNRRWLPPCPCLGILPIATLFNFVPQVQAEVERAKLAAEQQARIEVESLQQRIKEMEEFVERADAQRLEMAAKVTDLTAQLAAVKREEQDSFDQVCGLLVVQGECWLCLGLCRVHGAISHGSVRQAMHATASIGGAIPAAGRHGSPLDILYCCFNHANAGCFHACCIYVSV